MDDSITGNNKSGFGLIDVSVFVASLLLSLLIGVWYAYRDRTNKSTDNYYYGNRNMSPVSVGVSIAVSFISAITVLGYPAETYMYGTVTMWYCFQLVIPNTIACLYYIPLVHRLKLKTIYQYLELRFSVFTRRATAAVEIINTLLYMGTTMYLPALALNAVTTLKLEWTILMTGCICTVYTAIGGIKAVVWTDVVQAGIMFVGAVAALIRPTIVVGGFGKVYESLGRGERLNLFEFDMDPRIRSTFWTVMVGTSVAQTTLACCNQSISQRYSACKSVSDARKAALISLFPKMALSLVCLLTGCVAFAFYENCDPLKSGAIGKPDQIVPYMITDIFSDVPGMAGLFVAAAYSGTMSSVSSGINAVTALILHDFIIPLCPKMSEKAKMRISLFTALLVGVCACALAFLASVTMDTVLSLVMKIRGTFGGPIMGLFTLGIFFPWTNTKGALTGLVSGVVITGWITIGGLVEGKDPKNLRKLPLSTENCPVPVSNFTSAPTTHVTANVTTDHVIDLTTVASQPEKEYKWMYAVSYMYLSLIGVTVTVLVGLIVSFFTTPNDPEKMNPDLFEPLITRDSCFSEKLIRFFRCGVPETKDDNKVKEEEEEELCL